MRATPLRVAAGLLALACVAVDAEQYSHSNGQRYLRFAAATHCSVDGIRAWRCNQCERGFEPQVVAFNSVTDNLGFVGFQPGTNEIVVSFRGTEGVVNWVEDIDAQQMPAWTAACPACAVHQGFMVAYLSISSTIVGAVRQLRAAHPGAALTVTGHSLGGAMAAICAMDLAIAQKMPVQRLVTFGQPRTGNAAFAGLVERTVPAVFRVTHNADVVPHVPIKAMTFLHHATEVFYPDDRNFKVCAGGEDPTCADSYKAFWQWKASDHSVYTGLPIGSGHCV